MDKYECIKVFVRASQLGSFTAAADELNLTQSAVSKKISWLEANIGFSLFHRNSRKIQLTAQGGEYLNFSERLIDEMSYTESRLKDELNEVSGELKLSVPSAMATKLLSKPISEFMAKHPNVLVNVSVNDRLVDLIASDTDIAIRASTLKDSGYKARKLFDNTAVYFASKDYFDTRAIPEIASDLVDHQCLTYSLMTPSNVWRVQTSKDDPSVEKVTVKEVFKSDSPDMLLKMARAGHGITVLPDWMASAYFDDKSLVQIFTQHQPMSLPMYAVYKAQEYQPYRIKAFIDHLVEYFEHS